MAQDDDLLTRLGSIAREREREADKELIQPSVSVRDPAALREAIVTQALAQQRARRAPSSKRAWLPRLAWTSGIAAAAAVLLVWILRPSTPPLPQYALLHHGSVERERGTATADVLQLRPSSRLELELKPQVDVSGPVELRLFVQKGKRLSQLVPDKLERSAAGAFRVSLRAGRHFDVSEGALSIVTLVCRPDRCERAQRGLGDASSDRAETWQVLRIAAVYAQ